MTYKEFKPNTKAVVIQGRTKLSAQLAGQTVTVMYVGNWNTVRIKEHPLRLYLNELRIIK